MLRLSVVCGAQSLFVALLGSVVYTPAAISADINRKIITELDPVAPASAAYEEEANGVITSKWGASADFNLAGVVSTGPEFWTGTFTVKGSEEASQSYRREDFWPGERHKLDAIRLRWNVTKWEQPQSMRGWFIKGAYSYMRVNSRANRYTESGGVGDALPAGILETPGDETDLITDTRHGMALGFGNRWLMLDQNLSLTLGASITTIFKRSVLVDSTDANARADYDQLVRDLPDTKMATRPMPEANLSLGWAW